MVSNLAPVAVSVSALRTVVSPHIFLLTAREKVVAVISGAVKIITWVAGISDHFPLESLHFGYFFLSQELFEVNFDRERHLAARIRARDRKLALVNLRAHVLAQALTVIDVVRGADGVQLYIVVIEKRHEADLASLFFFIRVRKHVLMSNPLKSILELEDFCLSLSSLVFFSLNSQFLSFLLKVSFCVDSLLFSLSFLFFSRLSPSFFSCQLKLSLQFYYLLFLFIQLYNHWVSFFGLSLLSNQSLLTLFKSLRGWFAC